MNNIFENLKSDKFYLEKQQIFTQFNQFVDDFFNDLNIIKSRYSIDFSQPDNKIVFNQLLSSGVKITKEELIDLIKTQKNMKLKIEFFIHNLEDFINFDSRFILKDFYSIVSSKDEKYSTQRNELIKQAFEQFNIDINKLILLNNELLNLGLFIEEQFSYYKSQIQHSNLTDNIRPYFYIDIKNLKNIKENGEEKISSSKVAEHSIFSFFLSLVYANETKASIYSLIKDLYYSHFIFDNLEKDELFTYLAVCLSINDNIQRISYILPTLMLYKD